jgi:hypothetical protein
MVPRVTLRLCWLACGVIVIANGSTVAFRNDYSVPKHQVKRKYSRLCRNKMAKSLKNLSL